MLDKLEAIYNRYCEIETQMNDPEITSDMKRYVKLSKDYKDLQPVVKAYHDYKALLATISECKDLLENEKDTELREMAKEELAGSQERREKMEEEIRLLLIPADPQDSKNAVVEIRGGTGGDEACIFAGDLFRMYSRYCEKKHWKVEVTDFNEGTSGGYKDITFTVSGEGVYGLLKYESGVHRVQRVPATETQGRIHTSAARTVELRLMQWKSDTIIAVIETVKTPVKDSRITFYNKHWYALKEIKPFKMPTMDDFILPTVKKNQRKELLQQIAFPLIELTFGGPDFEQLTARHGLAEFLGREEWARLKPYLRPTLTYRIQNGKIK